MPEVDREQWQRILDGALLPLVPLPRTETGEVSKESIRAYAEWMSKRRVGGVVVGAESARPEKLTHEQRDGLLVHWRECLDGDQAVIAPVGAEVDESLPEAERPRRFRDDVLKVARRALKNGANALWCAPPVACKGREKEADLIVDYFEKLAKLDVPLIAGYCDEGKPALDFSAEVVHRLSDLDAVVGIQVGGCGDVAHQQDICRLLGREAPEMPVITREHRFLSYALMLGAKSAALEFGACCTDTIAEMVKTQADTRYHRFHALAPGVELLASAIYAPPAGAHVQRILWALELTGVIPAEGAFDPDAPELPDDAKESLRLTLEEVGELDGGTRRKKTEDEKLDEFLAQQQKEQEKERKAAERAAGTAD